MVNCLLASENGVDVHARTAAGDPVLHTALRSLDEDYASEIVKVLIGLSCDPLEASPSGETPLHIAVKRGLVSVVQYLLSLGISPTPDLLHVALRSFNQRNIASMVNCLFNSENEVDVHARTAARDPVLHTALQSLWLREDCALETTKVLIDHGCCPLQASSSGETLLHIAIKRGLILVVRYLLSLGISPPSDLLHVALRSFNQWNKASMVICLLENGINVSAHAPIADGDPVLYTVLQSLWDEDNALETVKVLVGHGYDPLEASSSGKTPLHIAVERGLVSVVQYILSLGISPPSDLLHVALGSFNQQNIASMINFLLDPETGINVHAHTAAGDPVLHTTLRLFQDENYALETLRVLIDHGCNPLEANSSGKTPLHITVERGFVAVTRYLLSLGISPSPDLLHVALESYKNSDWKAESMIVCLLENGIDISVHARVRDGDPVLHTALRSFRDEDRNTQALRIVKILVGHGCNPLEASFSGETPLRIAVERGFVSVARHFLSLGVPPSSDLLLATLLTQNEQEQSQILRRLEDRGNIRTRTTAKDSLYPHFLREEDSTWKTIKLLVSQGCNPLEPNSHGEIPLSIAIEQGRITLAKILLSLCVPSSSPEDVLWVVLTSEQFRHKLQTVGFLIDQGASVLAKAQNGDSLLHVAIASVTDDEVLQVVTLLLRRGCDFVAPNIRGATPFHIAVERGCISVVGLFLWRNVPLPTDILFTAIQSSPASSLHVSDVRLEMIKVLVTSGCDTRTRNAAGLTSLDAAYNEGHLDVVDYLLSVRGSTRSEEH